MLTHFRNQVRSLAIIFSVLSLAIPIFAQVKKSKPAAPQKEAQQMNPFAALTPIESGAGVIICSPKASDPIMGSMGAGVSTWLQYQLTASSALGKMPMFSEIHTKREELHFQNLQLALPQALDLARRIGVTHVLLGEITGSSEKSTLSYSIYMVKDGHLFGVPLTLKGSIAEIIAGMPGLAKRIAAALGDSQFPELPTPGYTVKDVHMLGRFTWSSKPDPKMSDVKALAEFGAKDPLAAIMGMRWYNYMSDRQIYKCTTQIDREAASNPLLIAETIQISDNNFSRWKEAIQSLLKKYTTSSLVNALAAKLQREDKNTDEELKYAEKAIRLNTGNPQYWLSLAHLYDTRASSLRQSRGASDITEAEWKKLNDDYAMWAAATIKAVELDDSNPHSWSRLAVAATFLSEKKIAYAAYDRGLELDPNNFELMQWGLQMFQPKWFDDEKRIVNLLKHITETDLDGNSAAYYANTFQGFEIPSAPLTERFLKRQRKIASDRPENPEPVYSMALFYGGTGRYEEAAKQYEKLLDMGILKENYFGHALSYLMLAGNQVKAAALSQRRKVLFAEAKGIDGHVVGSATTVQPNKITKTVSPDKSKNGSPQTTYNKHAWELYERSNEELISKKLDAAHLDIAEAIRLDPNNVGFHDRLAHVLLAEGKLEAALTEARTTVGLDETDSFLATLYQILRDHGRFTEAVQAVRQIKKPRTNAFIYLIILSNFKEKGMLKDAGDIADMALEAVEKGSPSAHDMQASYIYKGDILKLNGDTKKAEIYWKKALDSPLKDEQWTNQARIRLGMKSVNADGTPFTDSDFVASRAHWVLARTLIMKKDRAGYEKEMVAAVESDVTNDYYHYELAGWYNQTGRKDEALAQHREAARVTKEDTYCYYLYEELKARDKMDEAIQEAKKGVLKENHQMVPLYIELAKYEMLHDNIDNMKKMLDIGFDIQKGPHRIDVLDPDLYLLQGDMLLKQNKKAEARLAWQKAADYSNKEFSTVKDAKARLEANP